MRICERNGWTYAQWNALPENERIDRLAFQHVRDEAVAKMLESFHQRIADGKPVEMTAFTDLVLRQIA